MNILLVINTPGEDERSNTYALVPSEKLKGIDLDAIDGKIVNVDEMNNSQEDQIVVLYKRLGLEEQKPLNAEQIAYQRKFVVDKHGELDENWQPPQAVPVDLVGCLKPEVPFLVDKVVRIGWAV